MRNSKIKRLELLKNTYSNKSDSTFIGPKNQTCRNMYLEELQDIYFNEKSLLISIPILIYKADSKEISEALATHLQFTKDHIQRLEDFFISIGEKSIILKYASLYENQNNTP
ncbi:MULTISPECIES: DUF892 family protein [unclassified Flavobacterium]|jgi:hypothetical protein|uniref:DUF892 family protein n=1 Tax=unclassified Flavobacterium TaxID=196869 RepID=UPI00131D4DE8|nr:MULTISPECIES: DUF892 family protein [unclassified Flavobacterium]